MGVDVAGLVLTIASAAAGVVAAVIAWFAYRSAKHVEQLETERSFIDWQVESQSHGIFVVDNIGHDPAYDVTVEMWTEDESVKETRVVVAPAEQEESPLLLVLPQREKDGPDEPELPSLARRPLGIEPPPDLLALRARMRAEMIQSQVGVRIVWRSARGRWSTWTGETG